MKYLYSKKVLTALVTEAVLMHYTLNPIGKFFVVQHGKDSPFIVRRLFLRVPFYYKLLETIYDTPVQVTETARVICGNVSAEITVELKARYNPPHRSTVWLADFENCKFLRSTIERHIRDRRMNPSSIIHMDEAALRNQLIAAIELDLKKVEVDVVGCAIAVAFERLQDVRAGNHY